MTARAGRTALLLALVTSVVGVACGPRAKPKVPVAGPVGPAAEARQVEIVWKDGGTRRRWALVGALVHVGPEGALPVRFRGEKRLAGARDGAVIRLGQKVVGLHLTGLSSARAVALLRRHATTVETVVWQGIHRLEPAVVSALAALSTRELVLALWPAAEAPLLDLGPLAALGTRLYGLVLGAEVVPGGLRALRALPGLRVLELRVSVRADDLRDLAALQGLRVLRLRNALGGNRLGGEALRPLGRLRSLQLLDLGVNELTDGDLASLAPLAGLCWLDLSYNRIDGTGLARLASMTRLAVLDLDGNALDDDGIAAVAGRQSLRVLRLRKTAVGDDALSRLVALGGLRSLDVSRTYVGDGGLARLVALKGLQELRLGHTRVTASGVADFRRKRPGCRVRGAVAAGEVLVTGVVPSVRGLEGLPACQAYLRILRCYVGKLPVAARSAMQSALGKTVEAWQKMLSKGASARSTVARSCRLAVQTMKKALASVPMFRGCVSP